MQPKLGDFGLAKYLQESNRQSLLNPADCSRKNLTHVTVTSVHGTVAYLPPEYLRSKILSTAVDVYSYGIVLLEILTGCRAFDGKSLLLDKVMDEIDAISGKSAKNCQLLGEFGNLLSFKQKTPDNELQVPSIDNKFTSNCNCLSCKLYKLRDTKLPQTLESLFWYHCIMKLALDCCNKLKKKRPDFSAVLKSYDTFIEQFKQFNQCNQIFNLTGINTNRNSIASRVSSFKNDDAIKTPLEYKLWIEYKRKNNASAPPLPESCSPTDEQPSQQQLNEKEESEQPSEKTRQSLLDEQLINLSLSNRSEPGEEWTRAKSSGQDDEHLNSYGDEQEPNLQCVNEFVENFELPLITELGVRKEN